MRELAIRASDARRRHGDLTESLDGADLVVVENCVSLPLNVAARDVLYRVLDGARRALPITTTSPWQRPTSDR